MLGFISLSGPFGVYGISAPATLWTKLVGVYIALFSHSARFWGLKVLVGWPGPALWTKTWGVYL